MRKCTEYLYECDICKKEFKVKDSTCVSNIYLRIIETMGKENSFVELCNNCATQMYNYVLLLKRNREGEKPCLEMKNEEA